MIQPLFLLVQSHATPHPRRVMMKAKGSVLNRRMMDVRTPCFSKASTTRSKRTRRSSWHISGWQQSSNMRLRSEFERGRVPVLFLPAPCGSADTELDVSLTEFCGSLARFCLGNPSSKARCVLVIVQTPGPSLRQISTTHSLQLFIHQPMLQASCGAWRANGYVFYEGDP